MFHEMQIRSAAMGKKKMPTNANRYNRVEKVSIILWAAGKIWSRRNGKHGKKKRSGGTEVAKGGYAVHATRTKKRLPMKNSSAKEKGKRLTH